MRVAYIFSTQGHTVSHKLGQMILPQLEQDRHGASVAAMFFFEDNCYVMMKGNPIGERVAAKPAGKAAEYNSEVWRLPPGPDL